MYSVGLMSGTSLDGIDTVLVNITGHGKDTKIDVINFITMPFSDNIKKEIKQCCSEDKSSVSLICSLNFKLGYLFSEAVKNICLQSNLSLQQLDFISSHGQTIYHIPKEKEKENLIKSTLQIGEPSIIAYETNTKVISNFRTMDIAAGGEGAPLVPYSEFILYKSETENIALQNIWGISNVTIIPKSSNIDDVFAFDTGPGNMIIDELCFKLFGVKYDENGKIAEQGIVNNKMLNYLINNTYIALNPPKTTGREIFGEVYSLKLLRKYAHLNNKDIISTVTMFTAKAISINYKNYILPKVKINKIILGGGGAHNNTLLKYLKSELPFIKIIKQEDLGFSSNAKEAIAFVILGNETLNKKPSNLTKVTGAKQNVILGNIIESPRRS